MIIIDDIKSNHAFRKILHSLRDDVSLQGLALPRAARLPVLAALYSDLNRPILFVADRADHAVMLEEELAFWLPDSPRYMFPEPTPLFYETAVWGSVIKLQRLRVLSVLAEYHLPFGEKPSAPPIIITSPRSLMTRTIPRRDYIKSVRRIKKCTTIRTDILVRELITKGYEHVDTVLEPGQYCRRGGIIDVWSPGSQNPVRMEFFGNEVETLRCFRPDTQRTINTVDYINISPAREFITGIENLSKENTLYTEFHIPVIHPYTSSILDFLPNKSLIVFDDLGLVETEISQFESKAVKLRKELENDQVLDKMFPVPYFSWMEIFDNLNRHTQVELGFSTAPIFDKRAEDPDYFSSHFSSLERFGGRLKQVMDFLEKMYLENISIMVVSRQANRLRELWVEKCIEYDQQKINFFESSLNGGWYFDNWLLITDSEIFGWERPQPRAIIHTKAEVPDLAYSDISPGDWVVHIDYGIGRFVGLVKRLLDGKEKEFLCIEYQNNDQVFVPIHQADRLSKYISPGGSAPTLGHIGTQSWEETKQRVRGAVQEIAQDLLDLYAKRKISKGHAFKPDTAWQRDLESSFPYVETPDQVAALREIKMDMENPRPMDRLLCGDVGYGKTEVALRAAFKAVMDGKQVAVLVPTTVLAQQHYETFKQRLTPFPVVVEMLSRFRTHNEQLQILKTLINGGVDIIIGTHRLISSDVNFKDLGLVIIDEEQRFGVTHKERFKQLRAEVDVLTLTATPIPRTLYMALTGVRDISNLQTPPEERLPIVTHIGPYAPKLVRQAILRELERGGQIFFVHNRVQTIYSMKMHLEKLVPEARISIGHGQMPEQELATVMHKFTAGEIDILLSTSIIESGLDIPNANTLIVDRGDTFGLAQLYQLRGRVGRGAMRAYAYFFRHGKISPTPEGQERLETIAENIKLGSGYSVAMRDLEMRGAGDLLGTQQSGHIASVGFHLYTRLLAAAVRRLDKEEYSKIYTPQKNLDSFETPVFVELPQSSSIPEEYIPDQKMRLRLYRRMADLPDERSLDALADEFSDRFGPIPEPLENLFFQIRVKLRSMQANLSSINVEAGQIVLRVKSTGDMEKTKQLADIAPGIRGGKNAYWCSFGKEADWREQLLSVLDLLAKSREHV